MTPTDIRAALDAGDFGPATAFNILRSIALMLAHDPESSDTQALLIRSLEHRGAFAQCDELLNALLRETGLFPYIEPEKLSSRDLLALEFHRPLGNIGDNGIVFHRVQAQVYWSLLDGENVILSAPTSFGKSLIIDGVIASGLYKRIVLVVPTIALIDETRKRLARFSENYKIITHASQAPEQGKRGVIYVLTQERVIDRPDIEEIDFFVIDEFYKLDPSGGDRASILNHAFYKLLQVSKQFYLLGPNIRAIPVDFAKRHSVKVIVSDYSTVATNIERVDTRPSQKAALIKLAQRLTEPTLIYCQSPPSARRVVNAILDAAITAPIPGAEPIVEWISEHFHPDWILARAIASGIGIHHARLPRALAQLQVRLFNEGKLRFLVCTSTLIEGVNTAAKHVVIYDNQVASTKFDYFTFKNIQGRSGRMFRHFVGTVHLFHEPPEPELLDVDFPAFSQGDGASDSLLVQIDDQDLRGNSIERVSKFRTQSDLSWETIKANAHIDPELQIELATYLKRHSDRLHPLLSWRGEPNWDELQATCDLLFDTLLRQVSRDVVRSGRQLTFLIHELRKAGRPSAFIQRRALNDDRKSPDARIEDALDFLRNWASFHVPRGLTALGRIQAEVFSQLGLSVGDYTPFAVRLENLLLTPALAALDEYGIPLPLVERIADHLRSDQGLDEVLEDVKNLPLTKIKLSPFEIALLKEVRLSF